MPSSIPGPIWDSMAHAPLFNPFLIDSFGRKKRRLVTFVPLIFTCRLALSDAQRELLEDFFSITCSEGSSNFQWWDFRRPTNTTDLAVYAWRAVPSWSMDADWHIASLDLLLVRPVRGRYPLTDGSGGLLSTPDDEILTT